MDGSTPSSPSPPYVRLGSVEDTNSSDAQDALQLIQQLWELPRRGGAVPAPNPVSVLRANLPQLRRKEYLVSAKLDGTRYLLLLGRHAETGDPYSFLIDRAGTILRIQTRVEDDDLYQGTLIDGELMPACRTFVAFDIVARGGMDCKALRYPARLEQLRALPPLLHICEKNSAGLAVKPCVPMRKIAQVSARWPQDGLIFMPVDEPVRHGMHRTMFKWKPHHTIDFELVCPEDGEPKLLYAAKGGAKAVRTLGLALRPPPPGILRQAPCIVECNCHLKTKEVEILAVRPDKSTPNFERTVRLTLQNINENITHQELVQWCSSKYVDSNQSARS